MRTRYVIGNWKLHGSRAMCEDYLREWRAQPAFDCTAGLCVPHVYLPVCAPSMADARLHLGAQDCSAHDSGAHTGEVSAAMLADTGAQWVIVGHSERRADHAESDALVAAKAKAALDAGVTPIVCVGETLAQRDAGQTEPVVLAQLKAVTDLLRDRAAHIILAYEPVWAIGTGRTATPEQAQAVHACLRTALAQAGAGEVSILYGGSVKPDNARALFSQPDVDGGLIGGASLKVADFAAICAAAARTA